MTADLSTFAKVRALHDSSTSPGEKASAAARMTALASKAGMTVAEAVSKLDSAKPKTPAQAMAESFSAFFNTPEFVAERNEREARRRIEAAVIVERHGSEAAVFADTPMEAALRAACAPLLGPGETWETVYYLDGWGSLASRADMPASVRDAVSRAWPMPETVAAAWIEFEGVDRLTDERCTVERDYAPHLFSEARQQIVEQVLNTLPARSLSDLRARGAWLGHWADGDGEQTRDDHRAAVATLRADIERMGQRLRDQDAAANHSTDPNHAGPVHSGQVRRPTRAERDAAIRALFAEGHGDREIARRLGISPTTVGAVRRAAAG